MRKRETRDCKIGVLMIDVKDVAAACSIGVSTVWKLVKEDPSFPQPIYFRPTVARFKAADVRRWVQGLKPKKEEDSVAA